MANAWTDKEQQQAIDLYMQMRWCVTSGRKYSKAAMIRDAIADGLERSKGSIESKLMNISACFLTLNMPDLSMDQHGYKALVNYQASLLDAVRNRIASNEPQATNYTGNRASNYANLWQQLFNKQAQAR